jgi:hypothetical protein
MHEDALELGGPLVAADVVVRPIARRRIAGVEADPAEGVVGTLRPVGVLIEDGSGSRALGLDGDELPEDALEDLATPDA